MKTEQPPRFPRWMVLITSLLDVAIGYLSYNNLIPGKSIDSVIHSYHSFYEPAFYSFSMWGAIYLLLIVYAFYQLLYSQRNEIIFDRLAKPLIQLNLLAMASVIFYRLDLVIPTAFIIVWMFVISIVLYIRVRDSVLRHDYSRWISVPFSLYSGWLLTMSILTGSIFLIAQSWEGSVSAQLIATMIAILASSIIGLFVSYRCADVIFPSVVSWACIAVAVNTEYYSIAAVAILSATLPLIWFFLTVIRRLGYRHRVWENKLTFDKTMRVTHLDE